MPKTKKTKEHKIPVKVYHKGKPKKKTDDEVIDIISRIESIDKELLREDKELLKSLTKKNKYNISMDDFYTEEDLQEEDSQTQEKKVFLLWTGVIIVFVVIFIGWAVTLSYTNFFTIEAQSNETFEEVKKNMKQSYNEFSESLAAFQQEVEEIQEESGITDEVITETTEDLFEDNPINLPPENVGPIKDGLEIEE